MTAYTQLTQEQRYQISAMKKTGNRQTEIAKELGVHKGTISRELRRNVGERGYRPKQAHEKALGRRTTGTVRIGVEVWKIVEEKLRQDWSPEQVSGWLKRDAGKSLSHEWIYQHILADKETGGDLYGHLRCHKKRRKRYGSYDRRGKLPNRVSIEERPPMVEQRQHLGDWEADTLVGKGHRGALVSLVERKSRYTLLWPVERRQADLVRQATISLLLPFVDQVHTITGDNGKEFAEHAQIAETVKAVFYFAHPYSAWERGTNENTNGLVRQYFPKSTNFSKVTRTESVSAADKLNHRPRKCLAFRTPFEVFFEHQSVALVT
ncbi:MAG: IS30 family transposase [Chloroflexota bacterium]